jgi:hypothetical protein
MEVHGDMFVSYILDLLDPAGRGSIFSETSVYFLLATERYIPENSTLPVGILIECSTNK